jgi:competence protein ComEC
MVCVIMTGFAAVGALRHHVYWNWYPENEVGFRAALQPSPVAVRVTLLNEARQIAADPEGARSFSSAEVKICRALVRCDEIRDGNRWVKTSGLVWLRMPVVEPQLSAGDQVEVFGTLFRIEGPSNPGQYDFSRHYRRQRILASLHCFDDQAIKVLTPGGRHFISNLRTRLDRLAWRYLPPDQASLTSAILLGNREQVDVERRNKFLKTGTVHLLAISGLHVGILAGLLYCLFKAGWLGRTKCLLLTIVFVVFYAWLVEFRPPVVRATIFIVLFCLARLSGRTGQAVRRAGG